MRRAAPVLFAGAALAGVLVGCVPGGAAPAASARPTHADSPWFGWSGRSGDDRHPQSTYRLVIARDAQAVEAVAAGGVDANVWDSGVVHSAQSSDLRPSGFRYEPGVRYFWRVLLQDTTGHTSDWTPLARWTAPR